MILKIEKNTHATYLVKIQGDNKRDITLKEIKHITGVWSREETKREVLSHPDKKSETIAGVGGVGAGVPWKWGMKGCKGKWFFSFHPLCPKRHSVLTL